MPRSTILNATIIITALGYFVDVFDLVLFSIVRVASLKDLGLDDTDVMIVGMSLLNVQMVGLLVGGFAWGVIGDRRGRLSVLFGSILLYSVANIANSAVTSTSAYAVCRFLAGLGLAGELGAAVTLVSETLPKEIRGYGTSIVAAVGILGAVAAALVAATLSWRVAYAAGGILGITLLVGRLRLTESGIYRGLVQQQIGRGDLRRLFGSRVRLVKYLRCIAIGLPAWFVLGILLAFAPEITRDLGVSSPVVVGTGVMCQYSGAAIGNLVCGILSQRLKSRRKVLCWSLIATAASIGAFLFSRGQSAVWFYGLYVVLGLVTGYWAVLLTAAAEQFGADLRSTVTTTVPNVVRAAVVPLTLTVQMMKPHVGLWNSVVLEGAVCMALAFLALRGFDETYAKEMAYVEA